MQTLLFCALYNVSIDDINGEGLELPFGIKITTDNDFKKKLFRSWLKEPLGGLEYNYLFDAPIFYKIENTIIDEYNKDDVLCDFLGYCNLLLFDFWQIKDNAANVQMGYLLYPFKKQSDFIQTIEISVGRAMIHSNLVTTMYTNFKGKKDITHFSLGELQLISDFDINRSTEAFSELEKKKTLIRSSEQKISLAGIFIQMARGNKDLALKITLSCTALECLFTTDNKELSHKTAERAALLIGNSLEERKNIYLKIKEIYNVRSQVLHGLAISKKTHNKLEPISNDCDIILRMIYKKINDSPELDKFYRNEPVEIKENEKKETLDDYFLNQLLK